jgi:2-polyprenyl-3-methyl-5-hydroxy-6-metoxy-1,4-benzoquinol methylase
MVMRSFRQRSQETELMDEYGISFAEFDHCLRSLEIINILTLGYRPTLRWMRTMMVRQHKPVQILDAGSGGGDMLRRVERLAAREYLSLNLTGVDLNPWSKRSAETAYPGSCIRYKTADIFAFEPEAPVDIVICSLFTHHLAEDRLVEFLRWIDGRATQGWFINDLHRHPLPYYFIKLTTGIFSRNRLIRHDAAVSVARAFTVADWQSLLEKAEIGGRACVEWFFPFRLCVSCRKV